MAGEIKNIKHKVNAGNILTLEIDLNKDHGPSASGKNIIIASSGGFNSSLVEGLTLNLALTKKPA